MWRRYISGRENNKGKGFAMGRDMAESRNRKAEVAEAQRTRMGRTGTASDSQASLLPVGAKKENEYFSSHLLNSSSWANHQINRQINRRKSNFQYMSMGNSHKHENSKDHEAALGIYDIWDKGEKEGDRY